MNPLQARDDSSKPYPVFLEEIGDAVACTSTAASLPAAVSRLKYLCCTVGFFYRVGGTAVAAVGEPVRFIAAGVTWPVALDVGEIISFIASDADGIMTHSDMK